MTVRDSSTRCATVEGKRWYLIYSKPRAESQAMTHLERQGFHCYLPRLNATRKVHGRLTGSVEPMFPRYLFISLDTTTDNWAPIRSTVGVSRLVRFGIDPTVVPDDLIQWMMDREDSDGLLALPRRTFKRGERVRIYEGPFKDYEAIFLAPNSNERVIVLLQILGNESRLAIDPAHLAGTR